MAKQFSRLNQEKQAIMMSESYEQALGLARMLSYAAEDAESLGAEECRLLVMLAVRQLTEQFGVDYLPVLGMSAKSN